LAHFVFYINNKFIIDVLSQYIGKFWFEWIFNPWVVF